MKYTDVYKKLSLIKDEGKNTLWLIKNGRTIYKKILIELLIMIERKQKKTSLKELRIKVGVKTQEIYYPISKFSIDDLITLKNNQITITVHNKQMINELCNKL